MSNLICTVCSHSQEIPIHCGQKMHVEEVNGKEKLVCWMGPECGEIDIPQHCDNPMTTK